MAIKGQKYRSYPESMKMEAIRLHIEEKWTYRQITEPFGIQDKVRVKKWMKTYKQFGEFGFLDQRDRRHTYIDQDRYVQKLRRENHMLKKCWEIWMREVRSK
ncbi:transposase [Brevibacillus centrosporus]|uniref:transposase n=1 Tax=Brevibacillus centrosporus TaxID=54910 RepID=UPI002E22057A|nr:transposase [Brevibacillus centrosporus]